MEINLNELINEYNGYLSNVKSGCEQIVIYLKEENLFKALKMIRDFSEGMLWIEKVEEYLNTQNITTLLDLKKINEYLIDINEGLENQDFILVSDVFEYEIVPFFQENYTIDSRGN